MSSYTRHSCQWWARSAQHRVILTLQLCAFLSSPPPARASVSSAAQSAHCPPASRTHQPPTAPPPPNRPALLAFPPPLPMERTCEHKAEHAGPPTGESLPERCKQEPWPPPSCRHPLSPHPRPLAVTGHLTSSGTPCLCFSDPPVVFNLMLCSATKFRFFFPSPHANNRYCSNKHTREQLCNRSCSNKTHTHV
jgi:hypothetical protein